MIIRGIVGMRKILVVDNQPVFVKFVGSLLKQQGHVVLTAVDGLSALEILKKHIPDIIFIDLVMPEIDGRQLVRMIRDKPQFKDVRLVILSAIAAEDPVDLSRSGIDAYIAKGPLGKMADHVLSVIDQLDSRSPGDTFPIVKGMNDVSQREVIKELLDGKRYSEATLENMSEGVIQLTGGGKIFFVNASAATLLHLKEEELLGLNFADLLEDPHRRRVHDLLNGNGSFPAAIDRESTVVLNDRYLTLNISRIIGPERRSFIVILNDVSEHKRDQKALEESEERYRTVLEANPDPVVVYNMEGVVLYLNPAFTEVFGWTLEERLSKKMDVFVPEKSWAETRLMIDMVQSGKRFTGVETQRYTKDGEILPVSISGATYRDRNGRPRGSVITLRDITEHRQLEAQLQHAQKMESIGTITSGVAHNFRNILTGVSVNSQLVQIKFGDIPELMKIEKRTDGFVKRGTQLISELMQFSHRQPRERRPMDLADALDETYQLIRKSFDQKIDIQADIPDSLPVIGDYAGLSQVFFNLCTNARDAMPGGGELNIRAQQDNACVIVSVSDTGHGMDSGTLASCFDPFFTTKTVDKGTGLGLSTTFGIVKEHQGEIRVHSQPELGTTFTVRLPTTDSGMLEQEVESAKIIHGNGEKILIVDDEAEMIKSMAELLKSIGYRVGSATSGKAALDIYKAWRPDVVLLDRNMPEVDGIAYAEMIIAHDPSARIVLISGYEEFGPDGIDNHARAVTKAYLTKPIDFSELSYILHRLVNECK